MFYALLIFCVEVDGSSVEASAPLPWGLPAIQWKRTLFPWNQVEACVYLNTSAPLLAVGFSSE